MQDANQPVGETKPLGQHFDDISEQGLAQGGLLLFDALKRFGIDQPPTDFFFWVIEQVPQEA